MKKIRVTLLGLLILTLTFALLAGCSSGSSETKSSEGTENVEEVARSSAEAETDQAEATTQAVDPKEKFLGSWKLAAAESEGVTMGGNFGEILGMTDKGMLNINEDGTGDMSLGEEGVKLTWTQTKDDAITLTPEKDTDVTGDSVELTYQDGALFMMIEEEDKTATAIFTHDGNYDGVKLIDMEKAEPISSEEDLLGKWKMTGMRLMGVSISGDAESLTKMSGGSESSISFEEGGVVKSDSGDSAWKVDENGASYTTEGLSGKMTCPIKKLGDDIVIDMSEGFGGMEFIAVFSR